MPADTRPRRIGVSHVGLWALDRLVFIKLPQDLGISGPLSEGATYAWLAHRSAVGELMGAQFENRSVMQLHERLGRAHVPSRGH